ncbi:MAG: polyketide synthase, partial [bacterium]|nr:polyketide synthase [bacterium]
VQRVHDKVEFAIEYYEPNQDQPAPRAPRPASFVRPFDLSNAPLLRVGLTELEQEKHILLVDMHHIITDGTSMAILIEEFMALYSGRELPPLRLQYKDYSEWQVRTNGSRGAIIKNQEEYWLKRFSDSIPQLDFPTDYTRPEEWNYAGDAIVFEIPPQKTAKIKEMVLETGTTLYIVFLAVTSIVLSKYTMRQDIVVGTGVAGRTHADLEHVIGMFVNMLAIRSYPRENKGFHEFLEEVRENALDAFENQDYQFDELVKRLNLTGESGRNPLFDVEFTFQNTPGKAA